MIQLFFVCHIRAITQAQAMLFTELCACARSNQFSDTAELELGMVSQLEHLQPEKSLVFLLNSDWRISCK